MPAPHATLFHPFEAGLLPTPGEGERVLFLGAEPGFRLPDGFAATLSIVQGFRPFFLALRQAGFAVEPAPAGEGYDMALVALGRHRGEGERRVAEALARLRAGGLLLAAGAKNEGADSFRRRAAAVLPLEGFAAKHHGVAFWLRRPDMPPALAPHAAPPDGAPAGTVAAPGMFSHDRVDDGSRLLAAHLPADLSGALADFGAGWGYLSLELVARPKVEQVDLYEADWASLEAARKNLEQRGGQLRKNFFWRDLLSEPAERLYDAVVMNPPFHQGRAVDPGIGRSMIRAAAAALKPGGRLFLVANRGLPYEAELAAAFLETREIARDTSFKVLAARR